MLIWGVAAVLAASVTTVVATVSSNLIYFVGDSKPFCLLTHIIFKSLLSACPCARSLNHQILGAECRIWAIRDRSAYYTRAIGE